MRFKNCVKFLKVKTEIKVDKRSIHYIKTNFTQITQNTYIYKKDDVFLDVFAAN